MTHDVIIHRSSKRICPLALAALYCNGKSWIFRSWDHDFDQCLNEQVVNYVASKSCSRSSSPSLILQFLIAKLQVNFMVLGRWRHQQAVSRNRSAKPSCQHEYLWLAGYCIHCNEIWWCTDLSMTSSWETHVEAWGQSDATKRKTFKQVCINIPTASWFATQRRSTTHAKFDAGTEKGSDQHPSMLKFTQFREHAGPAKRERIAGRWCCSISSLQRWIVIQTSLPPSPDLIPWVRPRRDLFC